MVKQDNPFKDSELTYEHRLVKRTVVFPDDSKDSYLGVYDLFYNKDKKLVFVREDPIGICGSDMGDIIELLDQVQECITKPILDFDEIKDRAERNRLQFISQSPSLDKVKEELKNTDEKTLGEILDNETERGF